MLLLISSLDSCEKDAQNERLKNNIAKINIENQSFKNEITKSNEKISSQSQIILTQKEAIDNGIIEIERLKNIKSKVRVVTQTVIDSVFIPYTQIKYTDSSFKDKVEFKNYFDYLEPKGWYSIKGYATNLGINIDSLRVKNDYSIYIADKKLGLFKKPDPQVLLLNKNPFTETIQMSNVVIVVEKPFYNKNVFWGGVGLVGGFLLAK
jgi:hypothetical protein